MPLSRKRKRVSRKRAFFTAARTRTIGALARARRARKPYTRNVRSRVQRLEGMIETKSACWNSGTVMRNLPHNDIYIVISPGNGQPNSYLNMLQVNQGVQDAQGNGQASNRIGDKITVRGVMLKAIFENALNRPKVFYRLMVIKASRGDVPTRATLFHNNSPVKMIDQVNTERYTIIASKKWTISTSNATASIANAVDGAPEELDVAGLTNAGMGTKAINMWIPGTKFGRGGNVTFSADASVQPKFFDYYVVCMAYDWYGTPQDINTVGKINTLYTKMYFKDA